MSDKASNAGSASGSNDSGPQFTEREMAFMKAAWRCLKSGPPEIDYEKLAGILGMTNPRSASNAWAKIKAKLAVDNPDAADVSPKKKATTPRKKAAAKKDDSDEANANGDGDVPATPKKTPRKRAPKKQDVDGEESPKKKGRTPKAKKQVSAAEVKAEDDDSEKDVLNGDAAPEAMDVTVEEV